ncbi:T9SS C-terminal target domain-containing protein [Brumimicrobium aurantiacum]|uniref:T9SS C-terminal target domain-containing protein n=2 Tax=Brumimicrobium aurantiacum TaxID=1737063 RepID=A0A3E1EUM2_9FLAO|nr:T9SS C-terminal target domain-containing protein [Brumimicrobium aurantiacum]
MEVFGLMFMKKEFPNLTAIIGQITPNQTHQFLIQILATLKVMQMVMSGCFHDLIKFDGVNWTVYNSSNTNLPQVLGRFSIDSNGVLWMTSSNLGLIRFDENNTEYFVTSNSSIISNEVIDVIIDINDIIWLSTDHGISKFDGQTWENYTTYNSALPNSNVISLAISNGEVWGLWSEGENLGSGLFMFDGTDFTEFNDTNSSLPSNLHGNLQITSNGDKWLLSGDLLKPEIIQFNDVETIYHDIKNSPLQSNRIEDIDVDNSGKLWIPGLNISSIQSQLLTYKNHNWESYNINSSNGWVAIQNDSNIWVGISDGVVKLENGNTTIYNSTNSGLPSDFVSDGTVDSLGNMWFTTWEGVVKYDGSNWTVYDSTNSTIPHFYSLDIAVDASNNIWIGTNNDGIFKYDGTDWTVYNDSNTGFVTSYIDAIETDIQGNLWAGTRFNGLLKFDGSSWTNYNSSNSSLPSDYISALGMDKQNRLWVGTWAGVAYPSGSSWEVFTTENSQIPHNFVLDFEFDDLGNVWMSTSQAGLGVYNPNGVDLSTYKESFPKNKFDFNIYPVPFNNEFNVDIEKPLVGAKLILYDISGRKLNAFNLNETQNKIQPNFLNDGVYFYSIIKNSSVVGKGKLVKGK